MPDSTSDSRSTDAEPQHGFPTDPLGALQPIRVERGSRVPSISEPNPPPPPTQPSPFPPPPPGATQPVSARRWPDPLEHTRQMPSYPPPQPARRRLGCLNCGCLTLLLPLALVLLYFLAPVRTTFLVLGIDRTPEGTYAGRSDTNILVTVVPLRPTVAMLSIPRDLWVQVPGVGEQRINTAHYFAELEEPGSGPRAAAQAVEENFGIPVPHYVRISFDSLVGIVDAMGGVTVQLTEPMAGLPAGEHRLNGQQALAFARDRSGTDDFFRMEHGQFLVRSMLAQMAKPSSWPQLSQVGQAVMNAVETDIPFFLWPRIGVAVLRAGPSGIDSRTLSREMVTPWTTDGGAQVLLPNWEQINPLLSELFGSGSLLSIGPNP